VVEVGEVMAAAESPSAVVEVGEVAAAEGGHWLCATTSVLADGKDQTPSTMSFLIFLLALSLPPSPARRRRRS
jgi:hypothetical protein